MQLTDNIRKLMRPADRRKQGKAGVTSEEAQAAFVARSEKELQNAIAQFLGLKGIWFDRDGMHRARTGTRGAPDFQFPYCCRYVAWEVKFAKGKLEPEQERVRDKIIAQGGLWRLITSLPEAMEHLKEIRADEDRPELLKTKEGWAEA